MLLFDLLWALVALEGPSRRSWCWMSIVFDPGSAAAVLSCNGLSEYFSCFFPVLCLPIVIVDSVRVNSRRFPSFVANSISARCNTACLLCFLSTAKKICLGLDIRSLLATNNKEQKKRKKGKEAQNENNAREDDARTTCDTSTGTRAVYASIYLKDATTNAEAPSY